MLEQIGRHLARNAIAYLALFVALTGGAYAAAKVNSAQVADNSLRGVDIRNRSVTGADIARRTLQANHFRPGVLRAGRQGPAGPAGPKGDPGAAGARGPSFSDGRQVGNVNDIACNTEVVVGSQALTATEPSRIWTHAQGTLRDDGSAATEFALFLRLRNAADTATLATSLAAWDGTMVTADEPVALFPGGVLQQGEAVDAAAPAFVAAPGAYLLQLVALATGGGDCAGDLPDFGFNQGGAMGYVLTGTG
jgi:hypothetical protein